MNTKYQATLRQLTYQTWEFLGKYNVRRIRNQMPGPRGNTDGSSHCSAVVHFTASIWGQTPHGFQAITRSQKYKHLEIPKALSSK